jgi:dUTP pyrophosphatase
MVFKGASMSEIFNFHIAEAMVVLVVALVIHFAIESYKEMKGREIIVRIRKASFASLPIKATEGAAMYDLYSHLTTTLIIPPGETKLVPTGLFFEVPKGYVMKIYSRSGTALKGLALGNCVGIVDSDYRGEVMGMLYNRTKKKMVVVNGERIAQFEIVQQGPDIAFLTVNQLSDTARGAGGFGSTNSKISPTENLIVKPSKTV